MILAALAIAGSAGYIGYVTGHEESAEEKPEGEGAKTASVKVAPAHMASMGKTILAYGVVRAAPEAVHVFSVPFETRVRRFQVTPGQPVAAGAVLLEVDPSPNTLLQMQQARSNVESATKKAAQAKHAAALQLQEARSTRESAAKILAQTQRRVEMKLGTSQELLESQETLALAQLRLESIEKLGTTPDILQAQQDLQLAQLQLDSLEKLGIGNAKITAETAGIVNNLIAQEGQIVPAGGPLIELAEEKRIEVKLSVEPGDAAELAPGHPVRIRSVHDQQPKPVEGRVRLVTRRVNPASRLVDVFVSLPPDAGLLLETFVRGQATVGERQALVVARAAVLPEEEKHILFTIRDGKAVEHEVKVGLEDDEQVEIVGGDLKPGELVVIEGNAELENGMAVEVEKEPAEGEKKAPAAKETPQ
jgi:RND family efflux transporter MFP subunit